MAAKKILGWSLAIAGVLGTGPLLLGRGQPAYKASLDEISQMSPVERAALDRRYQQYKALARGVSDVVFVGRLAQYRYYNMDQVVAAALKTARDISGVNDEYTSLDG